MDSAKFLNFRCLFFYGVGRREHPSAGQKRENLVNWGNKFEIIFPPILLTSYAKSVASVSSRLRKLVSYAGACFEVRN
jgi:hypothetical protein